MSSQRSHPTYFKSFTSVCTQPGRQTGATFISWMMLAGIAILLASAVVKVAPYYIEHYNVQKFMESIASEPNASSYNKRQVLTKVMKHLDINNLTGLEQAYYKSRDRKSNVDSPFTYKRLKKGNNRNELKVKYQVPVKWIGNMSFLLDFEHAVVMGEVSR